jgi:hypothetical protein
MRGCRVGNDGVFCRRISFPSAPVLNSCLLNIARDHLRWGESQLVLSLAAQVVRDDDLGTESLLIYGRNAVQEERSDRPQQCLSIDF